jgi:hypothetical protein
MDKYEVLDLEIINFEMSDLIITSNPGEAPGDIVDE